MACDHIYAATPEKPTNDRCSNTPTAWYAYRHLFVELCDEHRAAMEETMARQAALTALPENEGGQRPHPFGAAALIPIENPPEPWASAGR